MATEYSVGHAMRRRSGAPSNSLEAAGKNMVRNHETHEEAHERAEAAGSHRIPVGSNIDWSAPGATNGIERPRGNKQAADPTIMNKANRQNVQRVGATYRISPKSTFTQIDPAAGPTMNSAHVVPSVQGKQSPNFQDGISSSM